MKKLFTLFALATLAFAAQADVLTVCDGESTNNYAPFYGLYYDTPNTMTQMIYPADMLTDLVNGKISEVKFFNTTEIPSQLDGAVIQFSVKVVDQDRFNDEAVEAVTGATVVATTTLAAGMSELVFTFNEPFDYAGGNLMLETLLTNSVGFRTVNFYGEITDYFASMYQYVWATWAGPSVNGNKFLPKASFTFEASQVTPPEPTEMTAAPVFNGYTTDGIHAYFVEIMETEPSTIYYRVFVWDADNGEWVVYGEEDWTEYTEILSFTGDGKYRVEAYAVATDKLPSYDIAYEFTVSPLTGLSEFTNGKTVSSVRYFNAAGQEMSEANGLTIVVTTYTDGTTSTAKVIK